MSSPRNLPNTSSIPAPSDDFGKRLIEEYKILQDKVDKIGGRGPSIKQGWPNPRPQGVMGLAA